MAFEQYLSPEERAAGAPIRDIRDHEAYVAVGQRIRLRRLAGSNLSAQDWARRASAPTVWERSASLHRDQARRWVWDGHAGNRAAMNALQGLSANGASPSSQNEALYTLAPVQVRGQQILAIQVQEAVAAVAAMGLPEIKAMLSETLALIEARIAREHHQTLPIALGDEVVMLDTNEQGDHLRRRIVRVTRHSIFTDREAFFWADGVAKVDHNRQIWIDDMVRLRRCMPQLLAASAALKGK